MSEIKVILEQELRSVSISDPIARAKIARDIIKQVYDFVKFNRMEGEGFDGRDGPERRGLAKIVDAAENHYFKMLEGEHKG